MAKSTKKLIIITGAAGNLGSATVEKFISAGFDVVATVSPGKSLGYSTPDSVNVVDIDLSDENKTRELVQSLRSKYPSIDAASLLVGGFAMGKIADTDISSIRKMITLNFETAYNIARPLLEVMKSQPEGGRIVLVGSRPGLKASDGKNAVAYSLSKGMIFHLAELLNADGSSHNVVVHVIVPSTIDTPQNREAMPKSDFHKWVQPSEIAETIHFLCSDQGKVIRESVLKVYGNS